MSRRKKQISEYQWMMLGKLLRKKYSLRESFDLLRRIYPDNDRMKEISSLLERGISLDKCLGESSFERQLAFYSAHLSLESSIAVIIRQKQEVRSLTRTIFTRLTYQLVLVFCAFFLTVLFSDHVLPTMLESFASEYSSSLWLLKVFRVLSLGRNILVILIGCVGAFAAYVRAGHRETYLWMFLHQKKADGLLKTFITYNFAQRMRCFLKQGIPVVDALKIIRYQKEDKLVSLLAYHFDETLLSGKDFEHSLDIDYFDGEFHSLCIWGIREDDFCEALDDYLEFTEMRVEKSVRKLITISQVLSYGFVALVIIMAYQVLLLPLEMLEGM